MYTLFVLGELMDNPLTGYQLRDILSHVIGDRFTVSWGIIYPLLDKLEEAGDITLVNTQHDGGRQQNVAHLTDHGRDHFKALMAKPITPGKNEEMLYLFKLDNLHHLTTPEAIDLLETFIAYKTAVRDSAQTAKSAIQAADMDDADKFTSTALGQYRLAKAQAAIDWAITVQRELSAGALTNLK
ncbi:PadR family transcriptional regulator [Furfurilactobacillus sp. WILCCON 0119]